MSGAWLFLSALCGLVSVMAQSLTVIIVCLITSAVSLVVGLTALFAPEKIGAATPPTRTAGKAKSPGNGPRKPRASNSAGAASGAKPRKRPKCSARCRNSKKDKSTCRCSCGGKTHGVGDGPAKSTEAPPPKLPTRSQLRAKPVVKAERQVIRAERKARR